MPRREYTVRSSFSGKAKSTVLHDSTPHTAAQKAVHLKSLGFGLADIPSHVFDPAVGADIEVESAAGRVWRYRLTRIERTNVRELREGEK